MLKVGIFLDVEIVSRTGGRDYRFGVIRKLVEARREVILRVNTYLANDGACEDADPTKGPNRVAHAKVSF